MTTDSSSPPTVALHPRDLFCNRTLNLRSIRAIGYDMDYTLVHYQVEAWELTAYAHLQKRLVAEGFPAGDLAFDPELVSRGLIIDTELGNIVKANRFGYVKRALHGTRPLDFDEQRRVYARTMIDLSQSRWVFLNTLFSLSEGCIYAQLVDRLDDGKIRGVLGYEALYRCIQRVMDAAHMEGELKAEIIANPDRFVQVDPETPLALLDQRDSNKKLMLITNSEWHYTQAMMAYSFDRHLPRSRKWRDLFDIVIVGARKPDFFLSRAPLFEVVSEDGLLRPAVHGLTEKGIFLGGSASLVEKHLGLSGDEILYVGDHLWGDVKVSKSVLRWRTALVLRELEGEIEALQAFAPRQAELDRMMAEKEVFEQEFCALRLKVQRARAGRADPGGGPVDALERRLGGLREKIGALDDKIGPIAQAAGEVGHSRWGPLFRAGNDKSHLARQVESSADIYTSRVSNFLLRTPYAYLRSHRGNLPHDGGEGASPSSLQPIR